MPAAKNKKGRLAIAAAAALTVLFLAVPGCSPKKDGGAPPSGQSAEAVVFEDPAFEEAFRSTCGFEGAELTRGDLLEIKDLALQGKGLNNINDLKYFENLESLALISNEIEDISVLAGLKKLETLSLIGNSVSDISPLAELKELKYVHLEFNRITDIVPLAGLDGLVCLYLGHNDIADPSPVAGLAELEYVDLAGNLRISSEQIDELRGSMPNCYVSVL